VNGYRSEKVLAQSTTGNHARPAKKARA
jgi:hypothetical protein